MSLHFDSVKQVFRINITKGGVRIRRVLPRATSEETARAIHSQLLNDVHRISNRTGEVPGWRENVDAGFHIGGWATAMLIRATNRDKALGREYFSMTVDDLRYICLRSGGRCEVTGIPFSDYKRGARRPFFQSLDRIDCAKGYRFDNCRLVCLAVNIAMSNWGEDVVRHMAVGLVINQYSPPWLGSSDMPDSCTWQKEPMFHVKQPTY